MMIGDETVAVFSLYLEVFPTISMCENSLRFSANRLTKFRLGSDLRRSSVSMENFSTDRVTVFGSGNHFVIESA
jgi:hypothetical protein